MRLSRILLLTLLFSTAMHAAMPPELPRVYLDTTMPVQNGRTIHVPAGGNLQAAINQATYGDTIVLEAGQTYTGTFTLPEKTGTGWILIRSSAVSQLPEGKRVTPAQASLLARLVPQHPLDIVVKTQGKAHHYRLIGLEITTPYASTQATHYGLVMLGTDTETDLSRVAHDIVIDRSYLHGTPTGNLRRAIALNSARTSIIDSYISDCHEIGADSQAIGNWNGPGPFKIVNNFLEGAAENVMFGGDRSALQTIPADIELRYNHFYKPLSWKIGHPSYAGIPWSVKNLFEIKNAQRVLVENNVFENSWAHAQIGWGLLYSGVDGGQSTIENITTRYNHLKNSDLGFNASANNYVPQLRPSNSMLVEHNLFELNLGRSFQALSDVRDIHIEHNTVIRGGNVLTTGDAGPVFGMVFRNNLLDHGDYGVVGSGYSTGNGTMAHYFPGGILTGNVMVGGTAAYYSNHSGNFFPSNWATVQLTNEAARDYRLQASSPYKNGATDGTDIGADIGELMRRIQGVTDGSPTIQPPPTNGGTASAAGPVFSIRVYPNPWRKDRYPQEEIVFDWPGATATLKIFSVSGHLVRSFSAMPDQVRWNLRNASGDRAASGLYIYSVERADGEKTRGKFALIK